MAGGGKLCAWWHHLWLRYKSTQVFFQSLREPECSQFIFLWSTCLCVYLWEQTWPCASSREHFSLTIRESIKVEIFMQSNPTKWKAWSLVILVVTAPVKCYGGRCQLSCVLAPACHWRCFTVGLIGLLLCLHPCWLSVINTSASFDQPRHPSRLLLFLLFYIYLLITPLRGHEVRERLLIVLLHFVCSARSVVLLILQSWL